MRSCSGSGNDATNTAVSAALSRVSSDRAHQTRRKSRRCSSQPSQMHKCLVFRRYQMTPNCSDDVLTFLIGIAIICSSSCYARYALLLRVVVIAPIMTPMK
jgi:hypothetical protein